jgi:DNA repair exonuclease SbcCD ATPase subunit
MRLEIQNFRCYRGSHTFELNDTQTTLISGSSGVGKTSLMMALFFVITGQSPPKVISDGCDSCRVSLQWNATTRITRTKRPNRVTIMIENSTFEDDVAQTYIDRIFGKHFEFTSYVQQHYQRTFVYLSPTEKLEILERLCFEGTQDWEPETLKKQCAILLRELNHRHIEQKSRYSTLQSVVQCMDPPVRPLEPVDGTVQQYQKSMEELKRKLKDSEHTEYLLAQQSAIDRQLQSIADSEWTETQLTEHLYALKQLDGLQFQEDIWAKHSKQDCEELIADYTRDIGYLQEYRNTRRAVERMREIQNKIDQWKSSLDDIRNHHQGMYECPECHVGLMLLNEELVRQIPEQKSVYLSTDEKKRQVRQLEVKIEEHQAQTHSLAYHEARLQELEQLIDPTEDPAVLQADLQWIQAYLESETHKESQNAVYVQQRAEWTQRVLDPNLDRKKTQACLEQLRRRHQLESSWQSYATQLAALPVVAETKSELIDGIRYAEQQIQEEHQARHRWEMFLVRQKEYEINLQRQQEMENIAQELTHLEKRMNAMTELRQLILKTESEWIELKIAEISRLVNVYAEEMFVEPISVQLRMTKKTQTQTEKVQVQLEVFYKNMNCDISLLSGGEQARLNLAFILAFAHVFHSPLLLLDECTSNLDQELTTTVLEHIEAVGIPKVVLIAHQIVEGNFTQILRLKSQ